MGPSAPQKSVRGGIDRSATLSIVPEPTEEERAAIVAALEALEPAPPARPWREEEREP